MTKFAQRVTYGYVKKLIDAQRRDWIMSDELKQAAERWSKCDYTGIGDAEMYEQPLQRARDAATLAQAHLTYSQPLADLCVEMLIVLQDPANKDYAVGCNAMRFIAERWQMRFEKITEGSN